MNTITHKQIHLTYQLAKDFFNSRLSLKDAKQLLSDAGMNSNSAVDYLYDYCHLMRGESFSRTMNVYATQYYLEKILNDDGLDSLKIALLSLSQHIDYYEQKSNSSVKKKRAILEKFMMITGLDKDKPIYPDEVDPSKAYFEGSTKQVIVNNYERNNAARKKCIAHYNAICQVCMFDFTSTYGELGNGFIHVHHIVDISSIGMKYSIDPINDLVPVCPNCHAMLHKPKETLTIEKLKAIIEKAKK